MAPARDLPAAPAAGVPRGEHPRPDRRRDEWTCLNGQWDFDFDDEDRGLAQRWWEGRHPLRRRILVPFPFQAPLSGIHTRDLHPVFWYRHTFDAGTPPEGRRVLLHFGAVDYEARVWLNGRDLGGHVGGHTPFVFDVTRHLRSRENVLVVRAVDTESMEQPRGKQFWLRDSAIVFYTRTSGIWQPVWLEVAGDTYVESLALSPIAEHGELQVEVGVGGSPRPLRLRAQAYADGRACAEATSAQGEMRLAMRIPDAKRWSPEEPFLYDLDVALEDEAGRAIDRVHSYFGLRSLCIEGSRVLLNGRPLYQRLVLDQGYWPESLLTPPSDEAMRRDIELAKSFGFNGVRKHQKIEDPRWLYWADRLGLLVWAEMPSPAPIAAATPDLQARFAAEWLEAVRRDASHPSIVAWVPFNESWGIWQVGEEVRLQRFVERIVAVTRAADRTRPVCDNSGWMHVDTDIADVHEYEQDPDRLRGLWRSLRERGYAVEGGRTSVAWHGALSFFVPGRRYGGQPLVLSEYGGIGFIPPGEEAPANAYAPGWATDGEALLRAYRALTQTVQDLEDVTGYCYTQLTDVEQETNGLATDARKPKLDPERIARINRRRT